MKNNENMRIWEALGKTDPAHTKQFTRAGGFKGTAIKPMWANKQMTEFFGPCGIGWGMTEPTFNIEAAMDEVMVYCTAGLWYIQGGTKHGPVYGVGGDKVLSQVLLKDDRGQKIFDTAAGRYKTYPQSDDEAFKKAYTDALSNAMKFIGVAADVHMGLFDDNKYVQEVRSEFEEQKKAEVEAEIDRQKTGKEPTPINTLTNQLQASVAKETAKLTPEERAASERNKLAQEQGIFSIDGDVLHCINNGVEKKTTIGPKKAQLLRVTLNSRLPNGASYADCFRWRLSGSAAE